MKPLEILNLFFVILNAVCATPIIRISGSVESADTLDEPGLSTNRMVRNIHGSPNSGVTLTKRSPLQNIADNGSSRVIRLKAAHSTGNLSWWRRLLNWFSGLGRSKPKHIYVEDELIYLPTFPLGGQYHKKLFKKPVK
ncbi:hypothetical protein FRC03_004811 [Tulasnella sp. 419]|nr:hypothetical protein FRC03_004811 [Tulasnella sp. 419]